MGRISQLKSIEPLGSVLSLSSEEHPTKASSTDTARDSAQRRRLVLNEGGVITPADFILCSTGSLGQNISDHIPMYIRQTEIPSLEEVGQFFMIDTHEVHQGRIEVVDMHRIF